MQSKRDQEGVTTRATARRAKRLEARTTREGDEIVCSARRRAAVTQGDGRVLANSLNVWYDNQLGVSAGMIFGIKKCSFNSSDFGVITAPTYAAAP